MEKRIKPNPESPENSAKSPGKRRRWPYIVAGGVVLAGAVAYVGPGWPLSSKALDATPQRISYDQSVVTANGNSFTIKGGAYNIDGIVGGIRPDGSLMGIFDKPTNLNNQNQTSTRTLRDIHGQLPQVGQELSLQGNIWPATSNPKEALGLDYNNVKYRSELGDMNAWMVPAKDSTTWTIAVHGNGAPLTEMLRFIKPIHEADNNVLVINYRNDEGNPASPDGFNHLGDTEWHDVQSSVRYAKEHGAKKVNFFALSIGGSAVENYLRRAPREETNQIGKVVLDSPALNWESLLKYRVEAGGWPGFYTKPGMMFASLRAGIDFSQLSTLPGDFHNRTLVVHSSDDASVPVGPSIEAAKAQPGLVTHLDYDHGGHGRSWNFDPPRYETNVRDFLQ
jgi:uncharacterized protein